MCLSPPIVEICEFNNNRFFVGKYHMCPNCPKGYKVKSSLSRHMNLECNKEGAYRCFACNYKAKRNYILIQHLRLKHNISDYIVDSYS